MKYSEKNKPMVCMMTQSTCYRRTQKMQVKGVLWHSTGANNPTLKRYVQPDDNAENKDLMIKVIGKNAYGNDWNHMSVQAGLNAWIGKLADGNVTAVQTMPWNFRPWGCGSGSKGSCNTGWIQFEICEDGLNDREYFEKVYKEACELTVYLCKMYGIDPKGSVRYNGVTVPTILCHADSHKLGLGSNHGDVLHWFPKFGKNMDTVRADVAALMGGIDTFSPSSEAKNRDCPFLVKVTVKNLRIRTGAGTDTAWTGKYVPTGVYTIVEVKSGKGSDAGWGRLKSGAGWIALSYAKRV